MSLQMTDDRYCKHNLFSKQDLIQYELLIKLVSFLKINVGLISTVFMHRVGVFTLGNYKELIGRS